MAQLNAPAGGSPGPPGPPGPPGNVGYTHVQAVPAAVWLVAHGLGYHPVVDVLDQAGLEELDAAVDHVDADSLLVRLNTPRAGQARCS